MYLFREIHDPENYVITGEEPNKWIHNEFMDQEQMVIEKSDEIFEYDEKTLYYKQMLRILPDDYHFMLKFQINYPAYFKGSMMSKREGEDGGALMGLESGDKERD